MTTYRKANALLKTEPEMKHDYSVAEYPYSKETYAYFVSLNKSKPAQDNTKKQTESKDAYGRIKPNDDIAKLGKELRELFEKNRYR